MKRPERKARKPGEKGRNGDGDFSLHGKRLRRKEGVNLWKKKKKKRKNRRKRLEKQTEKYKISYNLIDLPVYCDIRGTNNVRQKERKKKKRSKKKRKKSFSLQGEVCRKRCPAPRCGIAGRFS
ncbi:hypothetical protein PUN28_005669 [Cardiocondyla obscurior]|uniref:Ribosomal protein S14 n=1 Tax=Cardiocondyla obscurior TaxID=286306 RepID=A0AAW2G6W0_9HYME